MKLADRWRLAAAKESAARTKSELEKVCSPLCIAPQLCPSFDKQPNCLFLYQMEAALKSSEAKAASGDAQDRSAPVRALERIYFKHVVQGPGGKRAATRREVTALEALLCHVRCQQLLEAAVWLR